MGMIAVLALCLRSAARLLVVAAYLCAQAGPLPAPQAPPGPSCSMPGMEGQACCCAPVSVCPSELPLASTLMLAPCAAPLSLHAEAPPPTKHLAGQALTGSAKSFLRLLPAPISAPSYTLPPAPPDKVPRTS